MRIAAFLLALTFFTNVVIASSDDIVDDQQIQDLLTRAVKLTKTYKHDMDWFPSASIQKLSFPSNNNSFQWVGAQWEAPQNGLLIVTKNNIPVAVWECGAVIGLSQGPSLKRIGPTAVVAYQPSYGTGYTLHKKAVVGFMNNHINILWKHIIKESVSVLREDPSTELTYSVKFSNNGERLFVYGTKEYYDPPSVQNGSAKPHKVVNFKEASYCWNPSKMRYLPCKK